MQSSSGKFIGEDLRYNCTLWTSDRPIDYDDVAQLIFSKGGGKNVLVLTGTHGDSAGGTSAEDKRLREALFAKEDARFYPNVASCRVQAVSDDESELLGALDQKPTMIVFAWCNSQGNAPISAAVRAVYNS